MTSVSCCLVSCGLALAGAAALAVNARLPAVVLLVAADVADVAAIVIGVRDYRSWRDRMAQYGPRAR